jgi:tetratricopeptide (TPR) repeat protein
VTEESPPDGKVQWFTNIRPLLFWAFLAFFPLWLFFIFVPELVGFFAEGAENQQVGAFIAAVSISMYTAFMYIIIRHPWRIGILESEYRNEIHLKRVSGNLEVINLDQLTDFCVDDSSGTRHLFLFYDDHEWKNFPMSNRSLERVLERLSKEEPSGKICASAASIMRETGQKLERLSGKAGRAEIEAECKRALEIDTNCYPAYVYLGYCEQAKGNIGKMEEYYFKALEVADQPYNPFTWDGVIESTNDTDFLLSYLQKTYEKAPAYHVVKPLARIHWKNHGNTQEALALLNDFLMKHPEHKKALKLRQRIEKSR